MVNGLRASTASGGGPVDISGSVTIALRLEPDGGLTLLSGLNSSERQELLTRLATAVSRTAAGAGSKRRRP